MTLAQRLEAAGIVKGGHYRVKAYDWGADNAGAAHCVYAVMLDGQIRVDGNLALLRSAALIELLMAAEDGRAVRIADSEQAVS